ncbi:MAG: hypothetical protein LBT22_02810 [Peptococcaceae bacterium]|nr:hypothetical protein [Peptococcaceae bacterium]
MNIKVNPMNERKNQTGRSEKKSTAARIFRDRGSGRSEGAEGHEDDPLTGQRVIAGRDVGDPASDGIFDGGRTDYP